MSHWLGAYKDLTPDSFSSTWMAPANIAFVKYWGKKGHQLPANPSLSMTMGECTTTTRTTFSPSDRLSVELIFQGKVDEKFGLKIKDYLITLIPQCPWIQNLSLKIETSNTFPHGAGIASSASGLAAFAFTLRDYLGHLKGSYSEDFFFREASDLARLASGSACRSVYGGFTTWGDESDTHASPLSVHPELENLYDSVLVISGEEKKISSRSGHGRMNEHFFAQARFAQAKHHFTRCKEALKAGDIEEIGKILEAEALSLHAMMLTSPEAYTLFKPNSLAAMNAVWAFREETKLPLFFTLDAGPNLHLIYPESSKHKIQTFIENELRSLTENIIHDRTGEGPRRC